MIIWKLLCQALSAYVRTQFILSRGLASHPIQPGPFGSAPATVSFPVEIKILVIATNYIAHQLSVMGYNGLANYHQIHMSLFWFETIICVL